MTTIKSILDTPEELFNREAILKIATEAGINAPGNFRFHLGGKGDMYFEVRWPALRKFADLVTLETQALLARDSDHPGINPNSPPAK